MPDKTALVMGGTAGLGWELSQLLAKTHKVVAMGGAAAPRSVGNVTFEPWERRSMSRIGEVVKRHAPFDLIAYCGGVYYGGLFDTTTPSQVSEMMDSCFGAPCELIRCVFKAQSVLSQAVIVTSYYQLAPSPVAPIYSALQAGLGSLAKMLADDGRVETTLVVAPMGQEENLPPGYMVWPWIAEQIMERLAVNCQYQLVQLMPSIGRSEVISSQ